MLKTTGILVAISVAAKLVSAEPKLEVDRRKFDFGLTSQNSTLVEFFWFKSVGTDTVKIRKITTGCDCATMPLERNMLPPGDSMSVGFFWKTYRKDGNTGRYPFVTTNEKGDPLQLSFTASVVDALDETRPLSFSPYKVELSKIGARSIDTVLLEMKNHGDKDLELRMSSSRFPECTILFPDTIKAGQTAHCTVILNAPYADQEFERSFTVFMQSSDQATARFTIPVRRKIYGK